jgi:hypothetical protein
VEIARVWTPLATGFGADFGALPTGRAA